MIAAACTAAITTAQARRFAAAYPVQPGSDQSGRRAAAAAAALWLAGQGIDTPDQLVDAATGLYIDAYLIGVLSALADMDGGLVDVGDWTPGDSDTARARLDELGMTAGLVALLATVVQAAGDILADRVADAGKALANGKAAGGSATQVADDMAAALGDLDRAGTSAMTAVTTASNTAALDVYEQAGVLSVYWETDADPCPVCVRNAAAGPVPMGVAFPSGDPQPPAHPKCRCVARVDRGR